MKTDAEKFADAALAAYTAYTEINTARRKGAHPDTIAGITAAAFEAIAIAFDTCRIIANKADAAADAAAAAADATWVALCDAH